jgi:hypothetical protein
VTARGTRAARRCRGRGSKPRAARPSRTFSGGRRRNPFSAEGLEKIVSGFKKNLATLSEQACQMAY